MNTVISHRLPALGVLLVAACIAKSAMALAPGFGTVGPGGGNPAVTFEQLRFYSPSAAEFPTYNGSVPTDFCSGSSDKCGEPMTFRTTFGGLLTATATDSTVADGIVYQDLSPDYGGLGVVSLSGDKAGKPAITSSDQIERGEALKLSFTQQVSVVGFHFFDGDHGLTRSGDFARLSIDGGAWQDLSLHPNYVTNDPNRWYTGTSFEFKWGNQDFYLGAIKITTSIPEAPSVALMLAGLSALGAAVEWTKRARLGATRS